jgi:cold shock protein
VSTRQTGTVQFFDPHRGYGFIVGDDAVRYFVHRQEVLGPALREGERVEFVPIPLALRGPRASKVRVVAAQVS